MEKHDNKSSTLHNAIADLGSKLEDFSRLYEETLRRFKGFKERLGNVEDEIKIRTQPTGDSINNTPSTLNYNINSNITDEASVTKRTIKYEGGTREQDGALRLTSMFNEDKKSNQTKIVYAIRKSASHDEKRIGNTKEIYNNNLKTSTSKRVEPADSDVNELAVRVGSESKYVDKNSAFFASGICTTDVVPIYVARHCDNKVLIKPIHYNSSMNPDSIVGYFGHEKGACDIVIEKGGSSRQYFVDPRSYTKLGYIHNVPVYSVDIDKTHINRHITESNIAFRALYDKEPERGDSMADINQLVACGGFPRHREMLFSIYRVHTTNCISDTYAFDTYLGQKVQQIELQALLANSMLPVDTYLPNTWFDVYNSILSNTRKTQLNFCRGLLPVTTTRSGRCKKDTKQHRGALIVQEIIEEPSFEQNQSIVELFDENRRHISNIQTKPIEDNFSEAIAISDVEPLRASFGETGCAEGEDFVTQSVISDAKQLGDALLEPPTSTRNNYPGKEEIDDLNQVKVPLLHTYNNVNTEAKENISTDSEHEYTQRSKKLCKSIVNKMKVSEDKSNLSSYYPVHSKNTCTNTSFPEQAEVDEANDHDEENPKICKSSIDGEFANIGKSPKTDISVGAIATVSARNEGSSKVGIKRESNKDLQKLAQVKPPVPEVALPLPQQMDDYHFIRKTRHLSSLKYLMAKGLNFDDNHAKFLSINLLSTLQFLLARRIIHADICPSKVVFNDSGYPCLTGYEKSEIIGSNIRREHPLIPRLEFCSPEQFCKQDHVTEATDIFSTGVLVYSMMFGRSPHKDANYRQTKANLLSDNFVPSFKPDGRLSREGEQFIVHCIRKNPNKRLRLKRCQSSLINSIKWFKNFDEVQLANQTYPSPFKKFLTGIQPL